MHRLNFKSIDFTGINAKSWSTLKSLEGYLVFSPEEPRLVFEPSSGPSYGSENLFCDGSV